MLMKDRKFKAVRDGIMTKLVSTAGETARQAIPR